MADVEAAASASGGALAGNRPVFEVTASGSAPCGDRRLRVLAGFSGSAPAGSQNMNIHQRLTYLARLVDLDVIVPRGAEIDPEIEPYLRLRRGQVPGSAGVVMSVLTGALARPWDIVITDRSIASLAGWLATRFRRAAWVADIWDSPELELVTYYRGLRGSARVRRVACWLKVVALRRILRHADAVLVSIHPEALRDYGLAPSRVRRYQNAIVLDRLGDPRYAEREPAAICYASTSLLADRGVGTLVDALTYLAKNGRRPIVHMFGDLRPDDVQRIQDHHLEPQFILHGVCPIGAVHATMQRCAIGVVPLDYNRDLAYRFPVKVLEYMAHGCVVVASDLPGIRTVIDSEEDGLLVAPGRPAELAAVLQRLLDDPDLATRLRVAARHKVSQYDAKQKAQAMFADLQALCPVADGR